MAEPHRPGPEPGPASPASRQAEPGQGLPGPGHSTAIRVTVLGASGLRDLDLSPGAGGPDVSCICEISGGQAAIRRFQTPPASTGPSLGVRVWEHEATLDGWAVGDSLEFAVVDSELPTPLGRARLEYEEFQRAGFDGELGLTGAGAGAAARLRVKVELLPQQGQPQAPQLEEAVEASARGESEQLPESRRIDGDWEEAWPWGDDWPHGLDVVLKEKVSPTNMTVSVYFAFIIFYVVAGLFCTVFGGAATVVWVLVILAFSLATLYLLVGVITKHPEAVVLGVVFVASIAAGMVMGLHLYNEYLKTYDTLVYGAEYTNVDVSAGTVNVSSASVLTFSDDAFTDDMRTVGYVYRGDIYCVAPVVNIGFPSDQVDFWAVGKNCCEYRLNFNCGTSRNSGNLTAVRMASNEDSIYEKAIRMASSLYGTSWNSTVNSLTTQYLLRFESESTIAATKRDLWWDAVVVLLAGATIWTSIAYVFLLSSSRFIKSVENHTKKLMERKRRRLEQSQERPPRPGPQQAQQWHDGREHSRRGTAAATAGAERLLVSQRRRP